jgi:uncharacterized protein (TIGR03086 family)
MSENLRRYTTIVFGLEHALQQVPPGAWENPSPCDGWTVRQAAGHAMAVVNNVAARGGVGDNTDAFSDLDRVAGHDPADTYRRIRTRFLEATDRPGALQRLIASSIGEMTLDEFIGAMCADTLVHTWDVARGAGIDVQLDPDCVAWVYAELQQRDQATIRKAGRYADAIDAGDLTDPQDALIAYTGRDPRWQA